MIKTFETCAFVGNTSDRKIKVTVRFDLLDEDCRPIFGARRLPQLDLVAHDAVEMLVADTTWTDYLIRRASQLKAKLPERAA